MSHRDPCIQEIPDKRSYHKVTEEESLQKIPCNIYTTFKCVLNVDTEESKMSSVCKTVLFTASMGT